MKHKRICWVDRISGSSLSMAVDMRVYSLEVLFKACYSFTDRCYLFLQPVAESDVIRVSFSAKSRDCDLATVVGDFSNALVDQKVRSMVASETTAIRELIVAQAFMEADLIDRSMSEADFNEDPKRIAE